MASPLGPPNLHHRSRKRPMEINSLAAPIVSDTTDEYKPEPV